MPVVIFLCSVLSLKQMWDFNIRCLHHIQTKNQKNRPTDPHDFFHERANKQFFLLPNVYSHMVRYSATLQY